MTKEKSEDTKAPHDTADDSKEEEESSTQDTSADSSVTSETTETTESSAANSSSATTDSASTATPEKAKKPSEATKTGTKNADLNKSTTSTATTSTEEVSKASTAESSATESSSAASTSSPSASEDSGSVTPSSSAGSSGGSRGSGAAGTRKKAPGQRRKASKAPAEGEDVKAEAHEDVPYPLKADLPEPKPTTSAKPDAEKPKATDEAKDTPKKAEKEKTEEESGSESESETSGSETESGSESGSSATESESATSTSASETTNTETSKSESASKTGSSKAETSSKAESKAESSKTESSKPSSSKEEGSSLKKSTATTTSSSSSSGTSETQSSSKGSSSSKTESSSETKSSSKTGASSKTSASAKDPAKVSAETPKPEANVDTVVASKEATDTKDKDKGAMGEAEKENVKAASPKELAPVKPPLSARTETSTTKSATTTTTTSATSKSGEEEEEEESTTEASSSQQGSSQTGSSSKPSSKAETSETKSSKSVTKHSKTSSKTTESTSATTSTSTTESSKTSKTSETSEGTTSKSESKKSKSSKSKSSSSSKGSKSKSSKSSQSTSSETSETTETTSGSTSETTETTSATQSSATGTTTATSTTATTATAESKEKPKPRAHPTDKTDPKKEPKEAADTSKLTTDQPKPAARPPVAPPPRSSSAPEGLEAKPKPEAISSQPPVTKPASAPPTSKPTTADAESKNRSVTPPSALKRPSLPRPSTADDIHAMTKQGVPVSGDKLPVSASLPLPSPKPKTSVQFAAGSPKVAPAVEKHDEESESEEEDETSSETSETASATTTTSATTSETTSSSSGSGSSSGSSSSGSSESSESSEESEGEEEAKPAPKSKAVASEVADAPTKPQKAAPKPATKEPSTAVAIVKKAEGGAPTPTSKKPATKPAEPSETSTSATSTSTTTSTTETETSSSESEEESESTPTPRKKKTPTPKKEVSKKATPPGLLLDARTKPSSAAGKSGKSLSPRSARAELVALYVNDLAAIFKLMDPRKTGHIDQTKDLPLLLRSLGLSPPSHRVIDEVLQQNGGKLTFVAAQDLVSRCLSYAVDSIHTKLHCLCSRHDPTRCGLVPRKTLMRILTRTVGVQPAIVASILGPTLTATVPHAAQHKPSPGPNPMPLDSSYDSLALAELEAAQTAAHRHQLLQHAHDLGSDVVPYGPSIARLASPTNPYLYHALLRTCRWDPVAYAECFYGLPSGFRDAHLYLLLRQHTPPIYSLSSFLTPQHCIAGEFWTPLEPQMAGIPSSHHDKHLAPKPGVEGGSAGDNSVVVTLEHAEGVPVPGLGTVVLSRCVRMCLVEVSNRNSNDDEQDPHNKTSPSSATASSPTPLSNILTVSAEWSAKKEDIWDFENSDSIVIRLPRSSQPKSSQPNTTTPRRSPSPGTKDAAKPSSSSPAAPAYRLFVEFHILTQRDTTRNNSSFDAGKSSIKEALLKEGLSKMGPKFMISCGWAELDIDAFLESEGADNGKVKRYVPIYGGSWGDKQPFSKDDIHARREGLQKISKLVKGDPKPTLVITLRRPKPELQTQISSLPMPLLCPLDLVPYTLIYRRLIQKSPNDGVLNLFCTIADDTDLFDYVLQPLLEAQLGSDGNKVDPLKDPRWETSFLNALRMAFSILYVSVGSDGPNGTPEPIVSIHPDTMATEKSETTFAERQGILRSFHQLVRDGMAAAQQQPAKASSKRKSSQPETPTAPVTAAAATPSAATALTSIMLQWMQSQQLRCRVRTAPFSTTELYCPNMVA